MNRVEFLLAIILAVDCSVCPAEDLEGHWEGAVLMRGVAWPVEMDLEKTDSELHAKLTVRSMGMVAKPIEIVSETSEKATVSFPFGLGDFDVVPHDGLAVSHRKLKSGRRISLILERVDDYQLPYQQEEVVIENGDVRLNGMSS